MKVISNPSQGRNPSGLAYETYLDIAMRLVRDRLDTANIPYKEELIILDKDYPTQKTVPVIGFYHTSIGKFILKGEEKPWQQAPKGPSGGINYWAYIHILQRYQCNFIYWCNKFDNSDIRHVSYLDYMTYSYPADQPSNGEHVQLMEIKRLKPWPIGIVIKTEGTLDGFM